MHENFYRSLLRIRRVEEEVAHVYPSDKIKSPVHLSIGQEAISVGVCETLRRDDIVFGTYRGHALYLAKGGDLNAMIAELYGKATGCARGKGGSMHLIETSVGVMGASAIVGTSIPQAIGYAYALKVRRSDAVVVCFFGDGATEEGVWHETMNFAMLKQLPILFVCENNFYAIHSHQTERQHAADITGQARAYGMTAHKIESGNVEEIYDWTKQAVQEMRAGGGPRFLECLSYRWKEHVGPGEDFHVGYRPQSDAEPWVQNDAVTVVGAQLGQEKADSIAAEIEAEIVAAFEFAENSPFPDAAELYTDVFKETA